MISIILVLGGTQKERQINVIEVLTCLELQTFQDYEFIVIEECFDTSPKPFWKDFLANLSISIFANVLNKLRYYTIYNNVWNVSWGKNVGSRLAKGSPLLIIEADIVFGPEYLANLYSEWQKSNSPHIHGWDRIFFTTREGKKSFLKSQTYDLGSVWSYGNEGFYYFSLHGASGGTLMVDRDFFIDTLGGYSENLFGYTLDDQEFARRLYRHAANKLVIFNYTVIHLWHDGRAPQQGDPNGVAFWSWMSPFEISRRLSQANLGKLSGTTRISYDNLPPLFTDDVPF